MYGRTESSARLHALLERDRVEVVDQQQRRDERILGERRPRSARLGAGGEQRVEDPLEAGAVHLHDRGHELLGQLARGRRRRPIEQRLQLLDALDELVRLARVAGRRVHPAYAIAVGVCITLRTLPLPVYMCTPHGRHGSNERTARMMSMPLKFSGPFSSKIGVFCTASS